MDVAITCSICLGAYEEDEDTDVVAIRCGHLFHLSCLNNWKNYSKRTECPQCRTKFTVKTQQKVFLNLIKKEDEVAKTNMALIEQLQVTQQETIMLEQEKERLAKEKLEQKYELIRVRNENQEIVAINERLKQEQAICSRTNTVIKVTNDKYFNENFALKEQNSELKKLTEKLKTDLQYFRIQQLKKSKPYVDLTCEDNSDDSDIEFVETKKPRLEIPVQAPVADRSQIINLDDSPNVSPTVEAGLFTPLPSYWETMLPTVAPAENEELEQKTFKKEMDPVLAPANCDEEDLMPNPTKNCMDYTSYKSFEDSIMSHVPKHV